MACHPQAWAAGAIPYLLVSTLGLEPDGFAGELRIREPRLPRGIEAVELKNVPVGLGTADLRFELTDGGTEVEVVATTGNIRVTTPPRDPASLV